MIQADTSTEGTPSWKVDHYNFMLKEFMPLGPGTTNSEAIPWKYYRIRKAKIEFLPHMPAISPREYNTTAIVLDGLYTSPSDKLAYNPLANSSSRHTWVCTRKHSRYFTPKPCTLYAQKDGNMIGFEWFQPNNKANQIWLSTLKPEEVHHGLEFAIQNSKYQQAYTVRKTIYVQFREFDLINYPLQKSIVDGTYFDGPTYF